jgi:heptosyltransferase-2
MAEVDEVIQAELRHGELQLGGRRKLARRLKPRGYGAAYVLPNSWKSALVPFFAGIPVRVGYTGDLRYGLLNRRHAGIKPPPPMTVHYAALAESAGTPPALPLPAPTLKSDPASIRATQARHGVTGRYAVFCPGAEYGPAKRWPHFKDLAERIDLPVLVLGSARDREHGLYIKGRNLAGETSLDEAIDLIAGAEYVVANDSGLMHVAAALGRPQVAVFGSSSPERTPPLSSAARVVWLKIECSPCFERTCPLGHFRCLNDLPAERVEAEVRALNKKEKA